MADSSFWRTCNSQEQCQCDWRLTAYHCIEADTIRSIYISNGIISAIVGVIAMALLYYRLSYRGQHIFDTNTQTGFIRPRPIESMILFAICFHCLRLVHSIILVTDIFSNVAFRSFAFEFPWAFGYAALSSYVFGISHTMSDSSHVIYNSWFHNPLKVDILCSTLIIMPFVSNNICSISAGIYAQNGDIEKAILFTRALYYFWTIYCGTLGLVLLYSGVYLVRLLNHHLRSQRGVQCNVAKVKTGILKVKLVIFIGCSCLNIFAIIVCLYGIFRERMSNSTLCSLVIAAIWTFDGPMATVLVELALILNPHVTSALGLIAVNPNLLSTLDDDVYSSMDDQRHDLSTSPINKPPLYTTSSYYNNNVLSSSQEEEEQQQQHPNVHRPSSSYDATYTSLSSSPVGEDHRYLQYNESNHQNTIDALSTSHQSFSTKNHRQDSLSQLEQDRLQYIAATKYARIPHNRLSSAQRRRPSDHFTPNPFATYY